MIKSMPTSKIIFKQDLYPRFAPDQALISRYVDSIDELPPITVNQDNILIDGFHRWKAHKIARRETIKVEVVNTESEAELRKLAYKLNCRHGWQVSNEEKKEYALEVIEFEDVKEIAQTLSVSPQAVRRWTVKKRKVLEEQLRRDVLEMYLKAGNTHQAIARALGVPRRTISDMIKQFGENEPEFDLAQKCQMLIDAIEADGQIPNCWDIDDIEEKPYFYDPFPEFGLELLLYLFTRPFDIVYDPMAGSGTTVDVCRRYHRRYFCSDLSVIPGRERAIRQWDIGEGLPEDLPRPDFAFIHPPAPRVSSERLISFNDPAGKYSEKSNDMANMGTEDYTGILGNFIKALKGKRPGYIAAVFCNGSFPWYTAVNDILQPQYAVAFRVGIPYSELHYTEEDVAEARKQKKLLCLIREVVIWWHRDSILSPFSRIKGKLPTASLSRDGQGASK